MYACGPEREPAGGCRPVIWRTLGLPCGPGRAKSADARRRPQYDRRRRLPPM